MDVQIKKKAKDDQSFQQRSRLGEELSRNLQQENLQRPLYRTDENAGQIKQQQEDPSSLFDISVNAKKLVYQEKAGIAAKKAREQLENNFAGLLEQERKEVSVPNLQEMKASHEAKYRTRVIKRTLKPNKMVTEQVVEEKERRTKEKSAMAKLTSTAWREVTDAKVKARADVDIDLKKKMDYRTFSQLSEFAPYLDKEQLNALVTLYGNGVSMERKHEKKKRKQAEPCGQDTSSRLRPHLFCCHHASTLSFFLPGNHTPFSPPRPRN